jgi:hypothetical protein
MVRPVRLEEASILVNNFTMELHGRIQNGAITLDGNPSLPEGALVTVLIPAAEAQSTEAPQAKRRVEFPLVRTGTPGSLHLTNDMIAEILLEQDIEALKSQWNAPS